MRLELPTSPPRAPTQTSTTPRRLKRSCRRRYAARAKSGTLVGLPHGRQTAAAASARPPAPPTRAHAAKHRSASRTGSRGNGQRWHDPAWCLLPARRAGSAPRLRARSRRLAIALLSITDEARIVAERVVASLAGDGHVVVGADLADAAAIRRMVDGAADRLGGLDVLVNNAGVFQPHAITETTYEEWQRAWHETLSVNLVGAANVSWCAAQHMVRGGGGSIVNVSSRGAFRANQSSLPTARARLGSSPSASPWLVRSDRTGSLSRQSRQDSSRQTWPPRTSLASAARDGGRKARSAASPLPKRWPQQSCFWPRLRPL